MTVRNAVLGTSGLYLLIRFITLSGVALASAQGLSAPGLPGLILALAASAVVPAVLILQLLRTRATALLSPIRLAALVNLVASILLVPDVPAMLSGFSVRPVFVLAGLASLLVIDAAVLLFLLSYKVPQSTHLTEGDTHATSTEVLPDIPIEELEE